MVAAYSLQSTIPSTASRSVLASIDSCQLVAAGRRRRQCDQEREMEYVLSSHALMEKPKRHGCIEKLGGDLGSCTYNNTSTKSTCDVSPYTWKKDSLDERLNFIY